MSSVSTSIHSGNHVGNLITDELLGINMRSHHNRTDDGSDFRQVMEQIETTSIRFAGGTVSEEHFDITDPNATRTENAIQVIHPDLIPARSDVPIVRTVTPLSDYLTYVNTLQGEPVVVLPTYRFFDQHTRGLTANAEADIRTFVRELMTDTYGDVGKLTLEIGNEFYQSRFNWTDAEFGHLQAQIAEWVDDEVSALGVRDDLTLLVQAGRTFQQNNALASHFSDADAPAIDGVILHFYGTSSVGDPLAMGRNIPGELAETRQAWHDVMGDDLEIAVTEWNVGESGENTTIVNGIMRSAPLLHMFAEMVRGGVDNAMIWAARTDGPGGLSARQDPGSELTPTGRLFDMLSESTRDMHLVDPGTNAAMTNASGQHVGHTYTFEGTNRSVTYFASGVGESFQLSADLSQQIRDGAYIYTRTLDVAPDDDVTDYWSEAVVAHRTDINLIDINGRPHFQVEVNPYQLIELHIVYDEGVQIGGDREHEVDDNLVGSALDDQFDGAGGNDKLMGNAGDDVLNGGDGADVLKGNQGDDRLIGGFGHDRLYGGLDNDLLIGGKGRDRLDGHNDDDILQGKVGKDDLIGGDGNDLLDGGLGDDSLFGGDGADHLKGGRGQDMLDGGTGNDTLEGMMGRDILHGGAGDDAMCGNNGNDDLFGGDGADVLKGGMGKDTLTGGAGGDKFVFGKGAGQDVITDFEDGVDAIEFMIESFGFDDLSIIQDGDDAVVRHEFGQLRLVDMDAGALDESDFGL